MGKKNKKPSYLKYYFKKCLFIPSILLALFLSCFAILACEYNFFEQLENVKSAYICLISVFVYYSFIIAVKMLYAVSKDNFNISNISSVGILLTAIIGGVYHYYKDTFTIARIIILSILTIYSLVIIILGKINFNPDIINSNTEYKQNNVHSYYGAIAEKFTFAGTIAISLVITFCSYLVFSNIVSFDFNTKQIVVLCVIASPFLLYLLIGSTDSRICMFDNFLISLIMSLPIILFQLLYSDVSNKMLYLSYILIGSALLFFIVFSFLRCNNFDLSNRSKLRAEEMSKQKSNALIYYFRRVSVKYNVLLPIACGSLLAIFSIILFPYEPILDFYSSKYNTLSYNIIPYFVASIFPELLLLFALIISTCNARSTRINVGDFLIIVCLSTSAGSVVAILLYKTFIQFIVAPVLFGLCIILLSGRVRTIDRTRA